MALAALTGCNAQTPPNDDTAEVRVDADTSDGSRSFALEGFDTIDLRGPDDVEVRVGESFSVVAEGDAAELDKLRVSLEGRDLRIGREGDNSWFSGNDSDSRAVRVLVTMPSIREASITGSGDMTIDRVAAESFEGAVAGSGNLSIAALDATRATFDIAGSGDISAAGTVVGVEISIAGSGNVNAAELRAETLDANIVGSGDVEAHATRTAEASLFGSGDVTVRGGARCSSNSMGSGELRCVS